MVENLRVSFSIVFPFLIFMSLGFLLKKTGAVDDDFMKKMNRFLANVMFPATVFNSLYKQDIRAAFQSPAALYCGLGIVAFTLLLMVLVKRWETDPAKQGAMVHCGYRSNCTFYALPISQGIFGTVVPEVAIALAAVVFVNNLQAVPLLEYYRNKIPGQAGKAEKTRFSLKHLLLSWVKTPVLMAAVLGTLWSLLSLPMPDLCGKALSDFTGSVVPLAFIVLGARLNFSRLREEKKNIMRIVAMKLVVSPLLFLIVPLLTHWSPENIVAVVGSFATPAAVISYSMTEQYGCDADMAAGLVSMTSALSLPSIFLLVFALKQLGFVP